MVKSENRSFVIRVTLVRQVRAFRRGPYRGLASSVLEFLILR